MRPSVDSSQYFAINHFARVSDNCLRARKIVSIAIGNVTVLSSVRNKFDEEVRSWREISWHRVDHEIVVDRDSVRLVSVLLRDTGRCFAIRNRRRDFDERFVGREIVGRIREEIRVVRRKEQQH